MDKTTFFRYKLLSHTNSDPPKNKKDAVKVYNIANKETKQSFQLVDAPGFVQSNSSEETLEKNAKWIHEYFLNIMCSIDAVLFFMDSSDSSLHSPTEKAIETLVKVFGKFIVKHFVCFIDNSAIGDQVSPALDFIERPNKGAFLSEFQKSGLQSYIQINSLSYFNLLLSQDNAKLFDMTRNNFQVFMTQKINATLSVWFKDAEEMEGERRALEEEINTLRPELD